MLTAQKYSLLIPTFNRPVLLDALLGYLADKKVQFPIFILDSSSNENKDKNRFAAKHHALNVRYLKFNEDARFDHKIGSALREIDSEYVSLCADDDVVFVEAIGECIDALDRDAELAACHGVYLNFDIDQPEVRLRIEYASPSIDSGSVVDRACQLLIQYEALNYAVYRRQVMLDIIDAVSQTPQTMFWELFCCMAALASGKVKRLLSLYHARRSSFVPDRTVFHPATWIAEDPDGFAKAFFAYREHLFKYYLSKGVEVGPEAKKTLMQAHVIYLCRELRDGSTIRQALAGTSSPLAATQAVHLSFATRLTSKANKIVGGRIVSFKADRDGVNFKATRAIRAMLSDDAIADLSRYCRASDRL